MPKHMSGEEFISMMERKKAEKENVEAEKKRRKVEREEKKLERERVKAEKAKERERKRAEKKATPIKKAVAFKPPFLTVSTERCVECGGCEEDDNREWVSCDICCRWWHITCTNTPASTASELCEMEWSCSNCKH